MQIQGLQSSVASQPIQRAANNRPSESGAQATSSNANPVDQVSFSAEAQQLMKAQASGATEAPAATEGIRVDKVAEIRRAIADGSYETEDKMSAALDRLLDSFA